MIPRTGITVSKKELLGLLLVFIVYVLLGGLVFMLLESPLEEKLRREIDDLRNEFQEKLGMLGDPNVTRQDMERLMLRLAAAHSQSLIDESGNDTHTNWSFENSFFFAITVVTTIGYGHLSPSTTPGRLFCILYATIGIPLTGILLAAIGGHYSQSLVKDIQRARKDRNSRLALTLSAAKCLLPWLFLFLVVPAGFFMWLEEWSFVESFYYCFITLSTIGFGDYVASNFEGPYVGVYKTFVVLWIIFGLGYLAMILNYISRMMRCKQIRRVERKLSTSIHHTQQRVGQRLDEVYQILHDVSRSRTIKPRNRAPLKRMQSFPAPELRDRNHNHKIQRLLKLVQTLKEDEPAPRPRRLSLPLPISPNLQPANYGRGSLQVFTTSSESHQKPAQNVVKNGYGLKPPPALQTVVAAADLEINLAVNDTSIPVPRQQHKCAAKPPTVAFIDVISAEPHIEASTDRRTVIDLEGLQCTRV
ncbi:LOW QUALITY PROTEIN: potassium channel subfamily K member 4-like [Uloborus diversus]|uniref:LOW QUALITY PROTEIN: potassium channel subfamily K member 4-like n=1 Tax=Uloborus diversus TaxID=327109 RepID=UPI0024098D4E|nr:LOW QUALITY PROTEIN: potassium channel subfamily K member 4-like [Uloborus diversus]